LYVDVDIFDLKFPSLGIGEQSFLILQLIKFTIHIRNEMFLAAPNYLKNGKKVTKYVF
jgi:hypothetical protein